MRRLPFTAGVALTAIAISAGFAVARSAEDRVPITFEALDTNNDAQITPDEMAAHRAARITRADADGDGVLTKTELEAAASQRVSKRVERMIERFDANEDGVLSQEELTASEGLPRHFRRADTDQDGSISKAEFDAAKDHMKKRRPAAD